MVSVTELFAGRFRLGPLLGQGGMSDVYRAVDETSGETVAVKVVRSGDPELARRLAQEVRVHERMEHVGLVRLLDTGVADGQAYIVMELIEGATLAASLRAEPLGTRLTAKLGGILGSALAYVHAEGIVHRDVKPSNILLGADGRAVLGDFGIARLLDATTFTIDGTTIGTVSYMAPEQLEDHSVGPAADIWSLGIVLLECLTGRRVYEGTSSEIIARRLAAPVPLPADLPVPWKLLLSGMLDHRPEQRLDGGQVAALALVTSLLCALVALRGVADGWGDNDAARPDGAGAWPTIRRDCRAPGRHHGGGTGGDPCRWRSRHDTPDRAPPPPRRTARLAGRPGGPGTPRRDRPGRRADVWVRAEHAHGGGGNASRGNHHDHRPDHHDLDHHHDHVANGAVGARFVGARRGVGCHDRVNRRECGPVADETGPAGGDRGGLGTTGSGCQQLAAGRDAHRKWRAGREHPRRRRVDVTR